jgi:phosphoribosylanthranilate isomerase
MTAEGYRRRAAAVKICGLQSVEMIRQVAHLPIDYIGLMFAPSKRRITSEQARDMIAELRKPDRQAAAPLAVGVFVNPERDELSRLLDDVKLDIVQLHGQESPELCGWVRDTFGVKVVKVVSLEAGDSGRRQAAGSEPGIDSRIAERLDPYRGAIDGLLLDTFEPVVGGGSGKTFSWAAIPPYSEWAKQAGIPLWVAGGLQADNVADLLTEYRPDGVDVSSGVETDGHKDVTKISAFVERVKACV